MTRVCLAVALAFGFAGSVGAENEIVFSGPQVGEKLTGFSTIGVYDDLAGKEIDPLKEAGDKPIALVFMHKLTRPSAAVMRAVTAYGKSLKDKGLHTYVVWLTPDRTEAETYLKRARGSLNFTVPVVISKDGAEGPGAYGLNREVTLTLLVGKDKKVTANYALIQPSLQADAPKVVEAIAKQVGVKAPTQEELTKLAFPGRGKMATREQLVGVLRGLINKDATPDDVKKVAEQVDKLVKNNRRLQNELGRIAAIGVEKKYGTDAAQEYLKQWAKKYGAKKPSDRP